VLKLNYAERASRECRTRHTARRSSGVGCGAGGARGAHPDNRCSGSTHPCECTLPWPVRCVHLSRRGRPRAGRENRGGPRV